ncbi:MAG: HAD family hydrolase [Candidatus Sumerlaeia bacterium]|nr:HAD family hydrolase [Candidatus Sumerlaeia bacterium]
MNRAVFLDRDGTLIEDVGYLRTTDEILFFPETFAALQRLTPHFLLFLVTNQPGVDEGMLTAEEVEAVNAHVCAQLAARGIPIAAVYVCPHRRERNCACRKPSPHFLHEAARAYDLDLERSFLVGDHPHDIEAARRAGARGVYVRTGHGAKHLADLPAGQPVVETIKEAVEWILAQSAKLE